MSEISKKPEIDLNPKIDRSIMRAIYDLSLGLYIAAVGITINVGNIYAAIGILVCALIGLVVLRVGFGLDRE